MSDYTVELRKLVGWPALDSVLANYPLYDNDHRPELNALILDTYAFRDIGFETPEMFLYRLRTKFRQIMPYYNQLYVSVMSDYDFLSTIDVESQTTDKGKTQSESSDKSTQKARAEAGSVADNLVLDFPQTELSGNENYASGKTVATSKSENASENTNDGTTTSSGESDSESLSTTKGRTASIASMIREFREAIINVDMMIVTELDVLFMQVWKPTPRSH